jgi:hypothetical protein
MKDKISSLITDLGLTKKQLYKVWLQYNKLSSEIGKANAITEMVLAIEGIDYDAFKYFIVLGFESINKEYFKEIENGTDN